MIKYFKFDEIFPRRSVLYQCNGKDVMCLKDHEIIDLFFERSEQAITELILKYGKAVRAVIFNILGNPQDAEECQSDVSLKRYHADSAQKRNSHYDVALEELEATIPALSTVEIEYDARELAGYLNRFLAGLSREDRYLFLRRYWYGDGMREIAQNLGLTSHAASVRLFRIRQKLLALLQKEGLIA